MLSPMTDFIALLLSISLCVCTFKIHVSFDGHLGCFHFLATVNNAAVYIQETDFISFEYIPGSRISRSDGGSILIFEPSSYFFIVYILIYIPNGSMQRFPLFYNNCKAQKNVHHVTKL